MQEISPVDSAIILNFPSLNSTLSAWFTTNSTINGLVLQYPFCIKKAILPREKLMTPLKTQKYVGAVENAVKILRRLSQADQPEGVATIARETGVNLSSTFNILKTLTKNQITMFDEASKCYFPGDAILDLAVPVLGKNPIKMINPFLEDIARTHSVLIAVWAVVKGGRIVLADRIVPAHVVHADMPLGARLPDLVGAVGRCIAANRGLEKERLRVAYSNLKWQNEPGFDAYWAEVEQARRDGFSFDFQNLFKGLSMAAVVVRDGAGKPRLGLSAITLSDTHDQVALRAAALDLRHTSYFIETNIYGRRSSTEPAYGKRDLQ